MTPDFLVLSAQALALVLWLSLPVLVASLVVGLGISALQAVTQLHEQAVLYVSKLLAVSIALLFCGGWMVHELVAYTRALWAYCLR